MIAFTTPTARRLLCVMMAASALSSSNAFLSPSVTTVIDRNSNNGFVVAKNKMLNNFEKSSVYRPSCSMVSMKTASDGASVASQEEFNKRYNNIQEVNIDLDRMAQRIGTASEKYPVQAAAQCQDLYEQVLSSSKLDADVVTFNTVIKAWSRVAGAIADTHMNHNNNNNNSPSDIDFAHMPSIPIYTARDAAEYATKMLMDAEQSEENDKNKNILPDRTSYNAAIDAWAKSRCKDSPDAAERLLKKMLDHERIKPDTLSYNGVLDAWAYSKSPDYIDRLHKIFSHMETLHENPETRLVKPTIRTVNTIINAHAKRAGDYSNNYGKEADPQRAMEEATKAHNWLTKMQKKYEDTRDEDYMPDVMTYTSVLDAYARCGQYQGTMKAEALLTDLKKKYDKTGNSKLQPNFRTYTSLIVAWSKTRHPDAPKRAEEILVEMTRLYEEQVSRGIRNNEETFKPNCRTYTGVIQCWARSRDPNKAQRALKLLKTMKDKYKAGDYDARPNHIAYNSAMDACSRVKADSAKQMEALKIAFAILKSVELEKNMRTTGVMYATLMRAVASLMPPGNERSDISKAVFDKAVAAGMVDYGLLKFMRQAMDNERLHEVLDVLEDGRGNIDFNRMPSAWRKNLK
jgi:hypothetical protein